jgi:PPOX class probable F420-dependent enzyme
VERADAGAGFLSRRAQIKLTPDEQLELLERERTVVVATLGPRGWPHVMPMWYVLRTPAGQPPPDGPPRALWVWTYAKSQKTRNLERDPRATLVVEAGYEYTELRGVQIEAEATLHRDLDIKVEFAHELTARYAEGIESVEGDAAAALVAQAEKRVVISFAPRRIATWDHRKLGGSY